MLAFVHYMSRDDIFHSVLLLIYFGISSQQAQMTPEHLNFFLKKF